VTKSAGSTKSLLSAVVQDTLCSYSAWKARHKTRFSLFTGTG